ncbi:MAG: hypothetical protein ACE5GW_00740 [Planctomycetota bacterium]
MTGGPLPLWRTGGAVFCISAATIALEIVLLRIFALLWWHHFAHLVIGTGLLGLGASGSALALGGRRFVKRPAVWMALFALAVALFTVAAQGLAGAIAFEPVQLPVDAQPAALATHFLLVLGPFLLAGLVVGLALRTSGREAPRIYAFNLVGSAVGAPLATLLLWLLPPHLLASGLGLLGLASAALLLAGEEHRRARRVLLGPGAAIVLLAGAATLLQPPPAPSPYKDLSQIMATGRARLLASRTSPLGRIAAVESPLIRYAPGRSLTDPGTELPPQVGLYLDGGFLGAVTRLEGDVAELGHLSRSLSSLPFELRSGGRALILGAGGGADILAALSAGMEAHAVEMNRDVLRLMEGPLAEFSGGLFRRPGVRIDPGEARGFLRRTEARFDLVALPPLDAFGTVAVSGFAPGESPLYTVEALGEMLDALRPGGVLALSRWLRQPARDGIRLLATAIAALEARGVTRPGDHLLAARDWSQLVIVAGREPFNADEIAATEAFLDRLGFDAVWLPGMAPGRANQVHILEEPVYHRAATALLGRDREAFLEEYPFDVRPVRDDRPFFFHTLKWASLPVLGRQLGGSDPLLGEWSTLLLLWSAGQCVLFAALLLFLPLLLARWRRRRRMAREEQRSGAASRGSCSPIPAHALGHFAALGIGYMTVEMSLLQRLTLFLAQPIYAATLVIGLLLLASGAGSLVAGRMGRGPEGASRALRWILLLSFLHAVLLPLLLEPLRGAPLAARALWAALLLLPLGFVMGIPFPLALRALHERHPGAIPRAWSANGFASVLATSVAAILALAAGYRAVALLGVAAYAGAYRSATPGNAGSEASAQDAGPPAC